MSNDAPASDAPASRKGWNGATITVVAVIAVVVVAAVVRLAIRGAASRPVLTAPAPPPAGYVGSNACAECHPKIAESYAAHPMAQSLHPVANAPTVERFDPQPVIDGPGKKKFRVEKSADGIRHHQFALGPDGEALYDQAVDIRYVLGSGKRGRSYIHQRDGKLFMSPVAWYTQKAQWDLSPTYQQGNREGFDRPASDRCLQCHSGRPNYGSERHGDHLRYASPTFREHAIGCERCHGPGEKHIARHRGSQSGGEDPIVNPARLSPAQREAVCNQCHLAGDLQFVRYGRAHGDFRPGDYLGDIWTIFVEGARADGGQTVAVSHVQQMQSSRCSQKSEGRLGCISCHDPHAAPPRENRAAFYRARCLKCHEKQPCSETAARRQAVPANGSCIHCHMPKLNAADVPHTTQTDHRILRRPQPSPKTDAADAKPDSTAPESLRLEIFPEAGLTLPALDRQRAEGLALAKKAEFLNQPSLAAQVEILLAPVHTAAADDVAVLDALAIAALIQQRPQSAAQLWEELLTHDPAHTNALFSLAKLHESAGEFDRARPYWERLIAAQPWKAEWHGRYSKMLGTEGKTSQALKAVKKGLECDPTRVETYIWAIELMRRAGEADKTKRFERIVRILSPRTGPESSARPPSGRNESSRSAPP